jgi:hypothetical protein
MSPQAIVRVASLKNVDRFQEHLRSRRDALRVFQQTASAPILR